MSTNRSTRRRSIAVRATAYDAATTSTESTQEFSIPAELGQLSDTDLARLHAEAVSRFDAQYGDGTGLDGDTIQTLSTLTGHIESLAGELTKREDAKAALEQMAARAHSRQTLAVEDEDSAEGGEGDVSGEQVTEPQSQGATDQLAMRVPQNRKIVANGREIQGKDIRSVVFARGEGLGLKPNTGVNFQELGQALDRRLGMFNLTQYTAAAQTGRPLRELGTFAAIQRPIPQDLIVQSNDRDHVEAVMARATSEKRLTGGSLVASGGWQAPSEILADQFLNLDSRDGIISLPEIGVTRGGVSLSTGPSFVDIYNDIDGFLYTEAQDIAGTYAVDANGVGTGAAGTKPVYKVQAPDFTEYRLDVDGLIIQSGLLAARGYPEHLARVIQGALVAHDHRIAANVVNRIAAASTAVTMSAGQVGAAAPILTAIELQVEHYRDSFRMARNATIEGVFPFWVRGVIRSDLSRRNGVDLLSVSDAQINAWFADRNVAPQFIYNWQGLSSTTPDTFTAWPTEVSFLLYAAGTWVKGISDVITLDTIYDSVLLRQNDFTALFTEEGWFVAKRGWDSRQVTVPIVASGETGAQVAILADGATV